MAAATTTGTMDTTAVMRITVITVDIATMAGTATTVATIFIAAAIAMTVTAVGAVGMMTIAGIVGSEVEVTLVPLREGRGEGNSLPSHIASRPPLAGDVVFNRPERSRLSPAFACA